MARSWRRTRHLDDSKMLAVNKGEIEEAYIFLALNPRKWRGCSFHVRTMVHVDFR